MVSLYVSLQSTAAENNLNGESNIIGADFVYTYKGYQWELSGLTGTLIIAFWGFALVVLVALFILSLAICIDFYKRTGQVSDSDEPSNEVEVENSVSEVEDPVAEELENPVSEVEDQVDPIIEVESVVAEVENPVVEEGEVEEIVSVEKENADTVSVKENEIIIEAESQVPTTPTKLEI